MAPERLRLWIIAVSLASLFFILPHIVEDFAEGTGQGVGLSTEVGAFFLGGFLLTVLLCFYAVRTTKSECLAMCPKLWSPVRSGNPCSIHAAAIKQSIAPT